MMQSLVVAGGSALETEEVEDGSAVYEQLALCGAVAGADVRGKVILPAQTHQPSGLNPSGSGP